MDNLEKSTRFSKVQGSTEQNLENCESQVSEELSIEELDAVAGGCPWGMVLRITGSTSESFWRQQMGLEKEPLVA